MSFSDDPMQSLRESPEVLAAGIAVVLGLLMLFTGIVSATTGVFRQSLGINGAIQLGGVLAGLSVPALIFGVWLLLPSTTSQKVGVGIGVAVAVLGIGLFLLFYPNQWFGDPTDNTLIVALVYSVGVLILLGYLFVGVANLQTQPQQSSRMSRRPAARQNGGPKSGLEVIKSIVTRKMGSSSEEVEDVELKLSVVRDTLEDEMGDAGFFESVTVDEEEDLIAIERNDSMPHPQFTAGLPPYVTTEMREGATYYVSVDENSFYVAHPEHDPTSG